MSSTKTAKEQFDEDAQADERVAEGKPVASSMATPAFDQDTGSDNISHRTPAEDKPADAGSVYATDEEWEEKQGGVEGGTVVAPPEPAATAK